MAKVKNRREAFVDVRYLIANDTDKRSGLTVNAVGFQEIRCGSEYPLKEHPSEYYFNYLDGRILQEYQILYVTSGQGFLSNEGFPKVQLQQGAFFILFPGVWHTYFPDPQTGWNEYYIGFSGELVDLLVKNGFLNPQQPVMQIGMNEAVVCLFQEALAVAKSDRIGAQQLLQGIVMHIIGYTLAVFKNNELNDVGQKIEQAKIILRENIQRSIDLKELASELSMSYSWFRRKFKEYTGYAPAKYFQELKIQMAKELLTYTDNPVKVISIMLHFESSEHFSTVFKKKTGYTPLEYRQYGQRGIEL